MSLNLTQLRADAAVAQERHSAALAAARAAQASSEAPDDKLASTKAEYAGKIAQLRQIEGTIDNLRGALDSTGVPEIKTGLEKEIETHETAHAAITAELVEYEEAIRLLSQTKETLAAAAQMEQTKRPIAAEPPTAGCAFAA